MGSRTVGEVDGPPHPPVRTFNPRRRALSPARAAAHARLAPRWGLDEVGPVLDVAEVFGRVAPVVLEIGFGAGEGTVALATARPEEDIVAVDVHTPGVARLLQRIEADGLTNVRVVHGDALVFLQRIAPDTLHGIRVFFPDPWPKARHRRRRLVRPDVVADFVDRLVVGGTLHLATDVEDYARQMVEVCGAEPRLAGGVVERPAWRPLTRFEVQARAAGRPVTDLRYVRTAPGGADRSVTAHHPG